MSGSNGTPELLVFLVIAVIAFGLQRLPPLARSLGTAIAEFRRATNGVQKTLEPEIGADEQRTSQESSASVSPPSPQAASTGEEIVGLICQI